MANFSPRAYSASSLSAGTTHECSPFPSNCSISLDQPAQNAEFFMNMGTGTTGPTMPAVNLKATVSCPGTPELEYRFMVGNDGKALEYENKPKSPSANYIDPPTIDSGWLAASDWNIDWDADIYGGHVTHVTVCARRKSDKKVISSQKFARDFWILGGALYEANGTPTLGSYLGTKGLDQQMLIMAKAIARSETNTTHFEPKKTATTFHKRYPKRSFDNGYGVFQLTNPIPTREQIWNWKKNTDAALILLATNRQAAKAKLDQHPGYTNVQLRLETYAKYNGGNTGGNYHVWNGSAWIEDPDYVCGCDNTMRKGKKKNDPSAPCLYLSQCYANVTHRLEY
ncbi:MAG: hypothetical protein H0X66_12095 [Verrucomicrobia bacterium]|nr:hypothetical protein [Verrucomicrobiota bacterium]